MKKIMIATGVAVLAVALIASAQGYAFNKNLTVGSTGSDVVALQTLLMASGYSIPSITSGAASTGYFGSQTKTAVVAYQGKNGIPTTGFVGPLTRAALNGSTVATNCPAGMTCTPANAPVVTCPVGFTCTPIGTTPGQVGTVAGITTPGVEGTLSVTQGAVSNSTLYVGDMKAPVMSLALQAQTSDISVQRVQLDLGANSTIYTKKFSNIYVMDGSTVLASMPLNINTVTKSNNEYYITLTGFNFLVSKNQPNRYLTIAVDVMPSIDTTVLSGGATIALTSNGVRGIDGAGIDQYAPMGGFSQFVTLNSSLADSADIKISTDQANAGSGAIIANSGPNSDQADKVTSLVFDVKAEKDNIGITQVVATTTFGGVASSSITTNAYLYDGTTLVASAAISSTGVATFSNINGATGYIIPMNTTKAFTVKVDIRNAASVPYVLSTTVTAAGISAQNSQGSNLIGGAISGQAVTPNSLAVQKAGAVFSLVGTPTLERIAPSGAATTTKYLATFTFNAAAQGTAVTVASTGAVNIGFYANSSAPVTVSGIYQKPVSGVTGSGPYTIADGSNATFTVVYSLSIDQLPSNSGTLSARVDQITTNTSVVSTYVSDTFRTNTVSI